MNKGTSEGRSTGPVRFFRMDSDKTFPWSREFQVLARDILRSEKARGCVNIILADDSHVRALNRDYRHLDKVTDVLSFCMNEDGILGEIYVAEGQVRRQAPGYGNTFRSELKRVLVHGLLHLCGYDHIRPGDRATMRPLEEAWVGKRLYGRRPRSAT